MRKKNYKGEILFVLISTFVVISIWVASDIYDKSVTLTLDKTLQFQIKPIVPTFDQKTIEKLRGRKKVVPVYSASQVREPENASQSANPSAAPIEQVLQPSLTPTPAGVEAQP